MGITVYRTSPVFIYIKNISSNTMNEIFQLLFKPQYCNAKRMRIVQLVKYVLQWFINTKSYRVLQGWSISSMHCKVGLSLQAWARFPKYYQTGTGSPGLTSVGQLSNDPQGLVLVTQGSQGRKKFPKPCQPGTGSPGITRQGQIPNALPGQDWVARDHNPGITVQSPVSVGLVLQGSL